jgi:hypothetical protein
METRLLVSRREEPFSRLVDGLVCIPYAATIKADVQIYPSGCPKARRARGYEKTACG